MLFYRFNNKKLKGRINLKNIANLGIVTIVTSFLVTYLLGFLIIPLLKKLKAGQTTKEIGPIWHKSKTGTPTMGGIFLIFGVSSSLIFSVFSIYFLNKNNMDIANSILSKNDLIRIFAGLLCAISLGALGFIDDFIKVIHKHNKGLSPMQKTTFQLTIVVLYFLTLNLNKCISTSVNIPFFGQIDFGVFYYIISILGMYGIINAVNLTDGLDGLVSSVTAIYAIVFIVITNILKNVGMNVVSCSLLGGCLGFLAWNFFPAKVFMGDTGSLFLGGLVSSLGFGVNEPVLILIIGIIYVIEAMSVVIQVTYFKLTHGKRIFKMSPIHHHFEMSGYSEVKILFLFSTITAIFGLFGVLFIKTILI